MHRSILPCQHIQKHRWEGDWSDYNRSARELLQSFILISTLVPSSSAFPVFWDNENENANANRLQLSELSAVSSVLFHLLLPPCIPPLFISWHDMRPYHAHHSQTRIWHTCRPQNWLWHLGMHDDFCNILRSMPEKKKKKKRIRYRVSARYALISLQSMKRHLIAADLKHAFPSQEEIHRKTVLPLFPSWPSLAFSCNGMLFSTQSTSLC